MFEYIKNIIKVKATFKEDVAWLYLKQIASGLEYLHSRKIVHRDLKGANIFLSADKRQVQVGDLNVSKIAKNQLLYTQTGTPYYASPEVWRDQPYDHKSDIWSLGCLIYEMVALKPPFLGKNLEDLNRNVQKGYFPRIPKKYSSELNDVISWMLNLSPTNRPDCRTLLTKIDKLRPNLDAEENFGPYDMIDAPEKMLGTINLPRDLKLLDQRLPKSNYGRSSKKSALQEGLYPHGRGSSAVGYSADPLPSLGKPNNSYKIQQLNSAGAKSSLIGESSVAKKYLVPKGYKDVYSRLESAKRQDSVEEVIHQDLEHQKEYVERKKRQQISLQEKINRLNKEIDRKYYQKGGGLNLREVDTNAPSRPHFEKPPDHLPEVFSRHEASRRKAEIAERARRKRGTLFLSKQLQKTLPDQ